MARRCFFVQGIEPGAEFVNLSSGAAHHLENVLRLRNGEVVEIRDGLGNAWVGEIVRMEKGAAVVRLTARLDASGCESPLEITLALAFARFDIMDLVVRQSTEMGVARLAAFRAARSQYALHGSKAEKKLDRWSKIAREALCQCGRVRAPEISIFEDLDRFLSSLPIQIEDRALRILALEGERERGLDQIQKERPGCSGVIAAIGPEGGWDDSEIERLTGAGFQPVHLGPRILRFETAAVALVSSIQLLWGDFGKAGRKGSEENEMH